MKKINVLFAMLAVVGLATMVAMAGNSDKATVGFSVENYFSLEIKNGDSVDFGQVDAFGGPFVKKNGTNLDVKSNTEWSLSTSKSVLLSPASANESDVLNALTVSLETTSGKGNDKDIKVDYTLDNLENLPAGDYVIEVTFTGTSK